MSAQEEIAKLKERIAYLEGQLSMAMRSNNCNPYYSPPLPPPYWLNVTSYTQEDK